MRVLLHLYFTTVQRYPL